MKASEAARVFKMAELALVDTMIFQEVLAGSNAKIPTLSETLSRPPIKQNMINTWTAIRKINYAPIFEIGLSILEALPSTPALEDALKILVEEAQRIASSRALLRHDLMGRIYHSLLLSEIAKYYATYYTSVPAAWLLARLALESDNPAWTIDWSEVEAMLDFRVGDLACGSGTLLSASYRAILDKHIIASASSGKNPDPRGLHRYLLEETLWGFDVLAYATHLAVTGLSLHNPTSIFEKSKIYTLPLTGEGKVLRLGSLDFLVNRTITAIGTMSGGSISAEKRSLEDVEKVNVELPKFNLIIMNPPFTRSVGGNLLFGDLPAKERKKLQRRLSEILKARGFSGIGQAGLGAIFIILSDIYLKEGGRLALVAPRSLISGVAWTKIREHLNRRYQVEYIINSHQPPNDWNFSENTDLSEVLLVARRTLKGDGKAVIANLWRKPANEMESIITASQLTSLKNASSKGIYDVLENPNASYFNITLGGRKVGEAYTLSQDTLKDARETWGQLAPFAQSELNRAAYLYISSGQIYNPGSGVQGGLHLEELEKIAEEIGPDVRQIHGAFKITASQTPYPAFWDHKSEDIRQIKQTTNQWLEPKPGEKKRADNLWTRGGRMMVVERLWLNSHRVTAVYLDNSKALSNTWWPIQLKAEETADGQHVEPEEHEKIQALWLNTTLGILGLLSYRQDTRGAWVKFKKAPLKKVPTLDLTTTTREQVDELLEAFDRSSQLEMPPLPYQFMEAAQGNGPRYEIDRETLQPLLGDIDLTSLYMHLAREPIISLNPLT